MEEPVGESPEAKQLREAIEEQQKADAARAQEVKDEAEARLNRLQDERDRRAGRGPNPQ